MSSREKDWRLLVVANGKFDVADPERGAGLYRPGHAGLHDGTIDRCAVGRPHVRDLQPVLRENQPRVAPRHRRMRQDDVTLVDIPTNYDAFRLVLQSIEIQIEAEFA